MIVSIADGDPRNGVSTKPRDSLLASSDSDAGFGDTPTSYLAERLARYDFRSRTLALSARGQCLGMEIEALLGAPLERAGEEGIARWEASWEQNLIGPGAVFDPAALAPRYLGKHGACRKIDGFEASTCSLGHGFPIALGAALDLGALVAEVASFGGVVHEVDGHDHAELNCPKQNAPICVVVDTVKGHGSPGMEGTPAWHHRSPRAAELAVLLGGLA